LLEDYYIDEISEIIKAWNTIHGKTDDAEDGPVETNPMKFFGEGGEILG